MRISVAGEDVEDNHVKQLHDVCCRGQTSRSIEPAPLISTSIAPTRRCS